MINNQYLHSFVVIGVSSTSGSSFVAVFLGDTKDTQLCIMLTSPYGCDATVSFFSKYPGAAPPATINVKATDYQIVNISIDFLIEMRNNTGYKAIYIESTGIVNAMTCNYNSRRNDLILLKPEVSLGKLYKVPVSIIDAHFAITAVKDDTMVVVKDQNGTTVAQATLQHLETWTILPLINNVHDVNKFAIYTIRSEKPFAVFSKTEQFISLNYWGSSYALVPTEITGNYYLILKHRRDTVVTIPGWNENRAITREEEYSIYLFDNTAHIYIHATEPILLAEVTTKER
jgi:hypothetical protein